MNDVRILAVAAVALFTAVALGSVAAGCTVAQTPTIDCATATIPTYQQLQFSVMAYCTDCHGATRAEHGVRYDTYDGARAHATIGAETIADGSMPEDFDMSANEAEQFYAWSQCGTPE